MTRQATWQTRPVVLMVLVFGCAVLAGESPAADGAGVLARISHHGNTENLARPLAATIENLVDCKLQIANCKLQNVLPKKRAILQFSILNFQFSICNPDHTSPPKVCRENKLSREKRKLFFGDSLVLAPAQKQLVQVIGVVGGDSRRRQEFPSSQSATGVASHNSLVSSAEVVPPPDFTSHELPKTQVVSPRLVAWEYLDLAALVAGLSLATYFALRNRSRRAMLGLTIVSVAWLGFWRKGCICPIGAIQNVTLAVFDPTYVIPLVAVAFFVLPLVFTLFFGRTFCAAVCPLGAIQELVVLRPVQVPAWLEQTLGLLRYVYLGAAVLFAATGTAFVICRYDPFVAFFRFGGSVNMLVFGGCMLLLGMFVGRPYCRYLCPYGAILGLLSSVSKWHARITPDECIQCRLCEDACPYGAIRAPTVELPADALTAARRRLALVLVLLPVLIAIGAILGNRMAIPLSRLDPSVRLAERVRLEETGKVEDTTDASDAFRNTGRAAADLYRESIRRREHFAFGGRALGVWVGLVIGLKLIHLSIRRRRADWAPDPANCVSCGRCFWYCPQEQLRLGLIQDADEVLKQT